LGITGFRRRRIIMRNAEKCKMQNAKCKINSDLAFGILQRGDE